MDGGLKTLRLKAFQLIKEISRVFTGERFWPFSLICFFTKVGIIRDFDDHWKRRVACTIWFLEALGSAELVTFQTSRGFLRDKNPRKKKNPEILGAQHASYFQVFLRGCSGSKEHFQIPPFVPPPFAILKEQKREAPQPWTWRYLMHSERSGGDQELSEDCSRVTTRKFCPRKSHEKATKKPRKSHVDVRIHTAHIEQPIGRDLLREELTKCRAYGQQGFDLNKLEQGMVPVVLEQHGRTAPGAQALFQRLLHHRTHTLVRQGTCAYSAAKRQASSELWAPLSCILLRAAWQSLAECRPKPTVARPPNSMHPVRLDMPDTPQQARPTWDHRPSTQSSEDTPGTRSLPARPPSSEEFFFGARPLHEPVSSPGETSAWRHAQG